MTKENFVHSSVFKNSWKNYLSAENSELVFANMKHLLLDPSKRNRYIYPQTFISHFDDCILSSLTLKDPWGEHVDNVTDYIKVNDIRFSEKINTFAISQFTRTKAAYAVKASSTELVSIVRSKNTFAFSSDERTFNIESYFRTVQSNHQLRMDVYIFPELVDMVMCYGEARGNGRRALHMYQQQYENRNHPHHTMFARFCQRLRDDGSLRRRRIGGTPRRHPFSIDDYIELKCKDTDRPQISADMLRRFRLTCTQRIPNLTGPVDNNDVTLQRNRNKSA
ncbi:hypothetical protein ANN_06248 [Periplaneta americana]|uniref:DUF4817 domain-containing protein n=1 Tax=Periplaneta americana TaxID=6978 RepID=A0ABQ8TEA5_PERAM|nr:hypothetical protein ANN_06248 [Periplaneta americana]